MKQTFLNLATAYVYESQARNRYSFYASTARKEGFEQIASIFQETADQEKEHASQLFKLVLELGQEEENAGDLKLDGVDVPKVRGTTEENLAAAIAGETHEYTQMYPEFAEVADKEGYAKVAAKFRAIAKAENHHADRYTKLYELVKDDRVFQRGEEMVWVCRECGYLHVGKEAPLICPSCEHAQAFYEVECENY